MMRLREWLPMGLIMALLIGASVFMSRAANRHRQRVAKLTERVCDYICKPQAWESHCGASKRCACLCADGAQIEYVPLD